MKIKLTNTQDLTPLSHLLSSLSQNTQGARTFHPKT